MTKPIATLFAAVLAVFSFSAQAQPNVCGDANSNPSHHNAGVLDDCDLAVPGGSKAVPFDRNDKAPPFRGTARETADYTLDAAAVPTDFAAQLVLLLPEGFEFDGGSGNPCAATATSCTVGRTGMAGERAFAFRGIRRVAATGTDATGFAYVCAARADADAPQCATGVVQVVSLTAPSSGEDAAE